MLRISSDLSPDASYKQDRFFKTLAEKICEFIPNSENSTIIFNLSFFLLPAEVDLSWRIKAVKKIRW